MRLSCKMKPSEIKNTIILTKVGTHPCLLFYHSPIICHFRESGNSSSLFLSILVLFLFSFLPAFAQDGKYHRVDSWEAAHYAYMDAVQTKDMIIKEYLFREIIGFYKRKERINYNPIASCYDAWAMDFMEKEDFSSLSKIIEEMKKELPEDYQSGVHCIELTMYLQKEEDQEKISNFSKELREKFPKTMTPYINGSMAKLLDSDYKEALLIITQAPKVSVDTELIKSYCYLHTEDYPQAIEKADAFLKMAKKLKPQLSTPHYIKGMALLKQDRIDEGKKELALARQLNYVNFLCLSNRNDALFKDRLEKEATEIESQLQNQQPEHLTG